jgi:alkylation response protein AidB-like acyl-CoA dehydrogenase
MLSADAIAKSSVRRRVMDVVRVNARDLETGEIAVFAIPVGTPGVSVEHTWDTMGMRGTGSHDLILDDVRVPASALGVRLPAEAPAWHPAFATVIRWFQCGVAGVYMGIADRARDLAHAALDRGGKGAYRDQSLVDAAVGRLEATHFRGSAVFEYGLSRVTEQVDPVDGMLAAITMRDEATGAARDVVDQASEVAGGGSYFRRSPLERLVRDVRASRHHPPAADVGYQMIGMRVRGREPQV